MRDGRDAVARSRFRGHGGMMLIARSARRTVLAFAVPAAFVVVAAQPDLRAQNGPRSPRIGRLRRRITSRIDSYYPVKPSRPEPDPLRDIPRVTLTLGSLALAPGDPPRPPLEGSGPAQAKARVDVALSSRARPGNLPSAAHRSALRPIVPACRCEFVRRAPRRPLPACNGVDRGCCRQRARSSISPRTDCARRTDHRTSITRDPGP